MAADCRSASQRPATAQHGPARVACTSLAHSFSLISILPFTFTHSLNLDHFTHFHSSLS